MKWRSIYIGNGTVSTVLGCDGNETLVQKMPLNKEQRNKITKQNADASETNFSLITATWFPLPIILLKSAEL